MITEIMCNIFILDWIVGGFLNNQKIPQFETVVNKSIFNILKTSFPVFFPYFRKIKSTKNIDGLKVLAKCSRKY